MVLNKKIEKKTASLLFVYAFLYIFLYIWDENFSSYFFFWDLNIRKIKNVNYYFLYMKTFVYKKRNYYVVCIWKNVPKQNSKRFCRLNNNNNNNTINKCAFAIALLQNRVNKQQQLIWVIFLNCCRRRRRFNKEQIV